MAAPMNVLVGVNDQVLNTNNSNFLTNKIGGIPDWIHTAKQANPSCKLCGKILYLVVQVYCPLEGSKYHRTLYIFACVNRSCWNIHDSWHIVRSQKLSTPTPKEAQTKVDEVVMTTNDWCNDADDWGCDGDINDCTDMLGFKPLAESSCDKEGHSGGNKLDTSEQSCISLEGRGDAEEFTTKLMDLRLGDDSVVHAGAPVEFLSFYINVFEEPSEHTHAEHELRLMKEYEQREGLDLMEWFDSPSDKGQKRSKNEKYEKVVATHGDLVFEKFLKRTSLCPQQCLRYCWGGTPLHIRKLEQTSLNRAQAPCKYCGSKLTFELQLMPSLVRLIQDKSNPDKTVEFGVVLVYTCSESCWRNDDNDASHRDEVVIVQPDPDQQLFKVFE